MNKRERIETVLQGGRADRVPFTIYKWLVPNSPAVPRLFNEGLTVLDCSVIYTEHRNGFSIERRDVTEKNERLTLTRIVTPVGELNEVTAYDPMHGSPWIQKHLVEKPEDLAVIQYAIEHTTFEPEYESWYRQNEAIGNDGIVLGLIQPIPIIQLWVSLMGPSLWADMMFSNEEQFDAIHETIFTSYKRQIDLAAESPAEIIWLADNVTANMISPFTFEKYCKPAYDYAATAFHQAGKRSFSHYDGINRPLKAQIAASGIDILEALTPPPMGDMTVAEMRDAWPNLVISLNFPGSLFLESDDVIESYANEFLKQGGSTGSFVIGCTEDFDTTQFDRAFSTISRCIANFAY